MDFQEVFSLFQFLLCPQLLEYEPTTQGVCDFYSKSDFHVIELLALCPTDYDFLLDLSSTKAEKFNLPYHLTHIWGRWVVMQK